MNGAEELVAAPYVLPVNATENDDGSVTVPLVWPIRYKKGQADVSVETVTIRRKNTSDNMAIRKLDTAIEVGFVLVKRLTGLSDIETGLLDDVDAEIIGSIIEGFTSAGQTTGNAALA